MGAELHVTVIHNGWISEYFGQFGPAGWGEVHHLHKDGELLFPAVLLDRLGERNGHIFDDALLPDELLDFVPEIGLLSGLQELRD